MERMVLEQDRIARCRDCVVLVEQDGMMFCDEAQKPCRDISSCKEWNTKESASCGCYGAGSEACIHHCHGCDKAEQLLAKFTVHEETFFIYGSYTLEQTEDSEGNSYSYPEFERLKAMKEESGVKVPYEPTNTSWSGHRYTANDMLISCLTAYLRADETFSNISLEEGLLELVNAYTNDFVLGLEGRKIPRRIFSSDMHLLYELILVTNLYAYYGVTDEDILMINGLSGGVVSDNYFATVGLEDSLEAIKMGDEEQLWISLKWFDMDE